MIIYQKTTQRPTGNRQQQRSARPTFRRPRRFASGKNGTVVTRALRLQLSAVGSRCKRVGACNVTQLRAIEHGLDTEDGSLAIGGRPKFSPKRSEMTISMVAHELRFWRLRLAIVAGAANGSFDIHVLELF